MGLFRIWKGDSASLHAARATRPREHLRRAFSVGRGFGFVEAWGLHNARGGAWGPRGASGPACTARCGRKTPNASPAKKAPAASRAAPLLSERQPSRGRSDGVEARATMLS